MKKILITGANSYIGTSFEKYMMENYPNEYQIDTLDMKNPNWKNYSFEGYNSIFHVSGIAHADVGKVSNDTKKLYYRVNTELAFETAEKAKLENVKQFIYMSSIIVFGESAPFGKHKVITKDTIPNPENFYGNSKLQAEIKLSILGDDNFKIALVRPPMIYGPSSKGNYPLLSKIAKKIKIFPNVKNQRSILYIENLCEFIKFLIINNDDGIFHPQNDEFISISKLVKTINPKIKLIKSLNLTIIMFSKMPGILSSLCNKAFGSITYEKSMSVYTNNYCKYTFEESIKKTEAFK